MGDDFQPRIYQTSARDAIIKYLETTIVPYASVMTCINRRYIIASGRMKLIVILWSIMVITLLEISDFLL